MFPAMIEPPRDAINLPPEAARGATDDAHLLQAAALLRRGDGAEQTPMRHRVLCPQDPGCEWGKGKMQVGSSDGIGETAHDGLLSARPDRQLARQ